MRCSMHTSYPIHDASGRTRTPVRDLASRTAGARIMVGLAGAILGFIQDLVILGQFAFGMEYVPAESAPGKR